MVLLVGEGQKHNISDNSMFDSWKGELTHKLKFHSVATFPLIQLNKTKGVLTNFSREVNGFSGENVRVYGNSAVDVQGLIALEGAKRRRRLTNYRMLFEHSRDSFLLIDLKGHILEANTAALKVYGYTREELCTMKIHDLRAEETRNLVNIQMQEAYDNGITFETYHVRRNGEYFPVEVSSHQVVIKFENILLSIIRDITDRKRLEMELVKTENINVIGKVASGLAHEIRNPITCVHGFLQLAASRKINQERFAENCNLMLQELDRANYIISELILVANDRGINLEIKSLNRILLTLLPSIQTIAKSQGKTVESLLEETPDILLDENEIRKLVSNLVYNALDSMIKGGKVAIKTHKTENTLTLSIEDNGSGINPEILNQLGTPFFTTKDTGTGLGLVICKSIAIRHNATMSIESSNFGTTVQITFNIQPTTILSCEM